MSNSTRTVVHLQINNKHEYYGSTSSLYDQHTAEELGLTKASLNNYFSKLADGAELIYSNSKCIIRKGTLYTKETTRGRKKATDFLKISPQITQNDFVSKKNSIF